MNFNQCVFQPTRDFNLLVNLPFQPTSVDFNLPDYLLWSPSPSLGDSCDRIEFMTTTVVVATKPW
jgi:hypothetical protein